jgi:signal transduction histidine kinase
MEEKVTNEKLAELIKSVATTLADFQQETREAIKDLHGEVGELRKGLFTETEKESLLETVKHIDERLEDETLGRNKITLTRAEYDATSVASGFPNRFKLPSDEALVD